MSKKKPFCVWVINEQKNSSLCHSLDGLSYQSYQWKGHGSVNFHTLGDAVPDPSRTEILNLQWIKNEWNKILEVINFE